MTTDEAVARLFEEYADLLEAQDDEYRPRSYRRAAENIRSSPHALEDLVAEGQDAVEDIEGVGESLAEKIIEYVETGEIETIETARAAFPVDMRAITAVEGVGPKTAGDLYRELEVTTLDELEAAAEAGRIRALDGYGEKTEANILENIPFARQAGERTLLGEARPIADTLRDHLLGAEAVDRCAPAGSLRRWCETVGDIDLLAAGSDHGAIVDRLTGYPGAETIEAGTAKASVRIDGRRVDLRVVDPEEWGSAIQYFTGSRDHNVRLRTHALDRDCTVNEYGVFDVSEVDEPDAGQRIGDRIAGETEAGVYEALGLVMPAPELREDAGEIDAAKAGTLPLLLERSAIRGDLHVHTDRSDGRATLAEMIEAATAAGHDYLAITDHADGAGVPASIGLSDAELRDAAKSVRAASETAKIEVFAGVEANIDVDGDLSVADEVLADLDLVIASPHSGLDGDGTDRLLAAIEHPHVDVIGHPTGRLLNERAGLEIDVAAVATAAAERAVALEINADPRRLDLRGPAVRAAIDAGATIAIGTDAHAPGGLENMQYGVHTARRGWAEAVDVLNTRPPDALRDWLA